MLIVKLYGKTFEVGERGFLIAFSLRWGMLGVPGFGIMCGVGRFLLKRLFQHCFKLLRAKKLMLLILSVGTMGDIVWDVIFTRSLHD